MASGWERIGVISQVAAAVSAATVTSLAIYGLFFTDLPERLVAQLRSEVADAKSELAELRRNSNSLTLDNNNLTTQKRSLQSEVGVLKEQLTKLKTTKHDLESDLNKARDERAEYFNATARIILNKLFTDLRKTLSSLEVRAAQVRDIPKGEKLLRFDPNTTLMYIWLREVPNSWKSNQFYWKIIDRKSFENFKKEITNTNNKRSINTHNIISEHLKTKKFNTILPEDRKQIFKKISLYMRNNSQDFSSSLEIIMPVGWSYADLPSAYRRVSQTQRRIREHLTVLEQKITP